MLRSRRLSQVCVGVTAYVLALLPASGRGAGSLPPGVSPSDIPPVCTATTNPNYCVQKTSYGNLSVSPHFIVPGSVVTGTIEAAAQSSHCGCGYEWGDLAVAGDTFVHTFAEGTGSIVSGCKSNDTTCSVRVPLTAAPNGACCLTVSVPISTPQGGLDASDWYMFVKGSVPATTTTAPFKKPPPPRPPLKVVVAELEPKIRSGLAVHKPGWAHRYPGNYMVDFVEGNGHGRAVCESGCVDIVVKVLDPRDHDNAVPGAVVDASVDNGIRPFAGKQWLCETQSNGEADSSCVNEGGVTATTDKNGKAYLRFWPPAVTGGDTGSDTLNVVAACGSGKCSREGKRTGRAKPTSLTVHPYEIYEGGSNLTAAESESLYDWTHESESQFVTSLSTVDKLKTPFEIEYVLLKKFSELQHEEELALHYLEKTNIVFYPITAFEAINPYYARQAMLGYFLIATGVGPEGLADDPFAMSVDNQPSAAFQGLLANYATAYSPLKIGATGIWFDLAKELYGCESDSWFTAAPTKPCPSPLPSPSSSSSSSEGAPLDHVRIDLKVFETSYCNPREGSCEVGYIGNRGIKPELYFELTLSEDGHRYPSPFTTTVPYNGLAWATTNWKNLKETFDGLGNQ